VPREVLKVCDLSYSMAGMMGAKEIDPDLIQSAYAEGTDALRKSA
jgi:hypothetical protein